jgi:CRP-like cAMP-binding protein
VELSHLEPTGKTVKRLAGPGSILGVEGMVTSTPHTMTARAATECELLYLDQRTFQVLLDSCPALARELLKSLSWKLQAWTDDFYQAAVKAPIIERLMRVLEITARECGRETEHGTRICIPLSVQDVADRIGCSRQWATKILKELEATGRLRRNGRWITLTRTTPARRIRLLVS